jgi:hypothetical protein
MIRELMDSLPLWSILLLTMAAVLVAIEVGYRTGRWRNRHHAFDSEGLLSAMTGAHLGLLAFIMAFSFSMAAGHHSDRKKFILDETNIIATAHLRAQLLQQPYADDIGSLIREYTHLRTTIRSGVDPQQLIADSEALHRQLWQQARIMLNQQEADEVNALMIESLNSLFDVHEKRVAAGLRNRIPPSIWVALFTLLVLSMAGIGYFSGVKGHRNPIASTGLALSFAMVLFLTADLDRPTSGLVQANSGIMVDLEKRLNAQ